MFLISFLKNSRIPLLCRGRDTKAWGLGGLLKAHSKLWELLFKSPCKVSVKNSDCLFIQGFLVPDSNPPCKPKIEFSLSTDKAVGVRVLKVITKNSKADIVLI